MCAYLEMSIPKLVRYGNRQSCASVGVYLKNFTIQYVRGRSAALVTSPLAGSPQRADYVVRASVAGWMGLGGAWPGRW